MRVLVCGGRDFKDEELLYTYLEYMLRDSGPLTVISGMARGADMLAVVWAEQKGLEILKYPADWTTHGRSAGPIRNQKMLDEGRPHIVVACPGGKGTEHMIRISKKAGVPVVQL